LREGLALCEKLIEAFPSKPRNRSLAARAWFNLSLVLRRTDQPEEALEAMAVSAKLVDELARQYPAEVDHQIDRVRTMTAHGSYLCLSGRPDEATARLEEATALADRLVAEHASLPAARVIQVRALIERGHHHACTGDPARAEELLRRALDSARHLAWRWPDHAPEERDGARAARDLAAVLLRLGRLDEARRLAEEALAAEVQGPAERASGRVVALLTLADIAAAQQDHARVTSACRELLPLRAGAAEYRRAAGLAAGALAGIARDGDLDGSQRAELGAAASDCALTLLERAVEAGFDDLENLRSAGDLEPLRRLPGFEEILRQTGGE
jgi:tetratricopeptide (TPR) repeat protein